MDGKMIAEKRKEKGLTQDASELRIDSGVSFRGKSVEFAPKIT